MTQDRTGGALTTGAAAGQSVLVTTLSSPDLRRWRAIRLGTVQWPGEPARKYLPAGSTLTDDERAEIRAKIVALRAIIGGPGSERAEKGAALARMLLAYPMGATSEEAGVARASAYLDALDDVPTWAITDAIRRWHRGEAGEGMNYSFAPAPAILRKLALGLVEPIADIIRDLEELAEAKPLDEAMGRHEGEHNPLIPRLRRA